MAVTGNVRFAVAVHVLVLLALAEEAQNSATIAESVGTHPVVIRRILGWLQRAGLVTGRSGPRGGFRLARDPGAIPLDEVFRAVESDGAAPPAHRPNPRCPVGRHVSRLLDTIGSRAERAFLGALAAETVAGTARRMRRESGAGA
jgi:Rrf2 family protein